MEGRISPELEEELEDIYEERKWELIDELLYGEEGEWSPNKSK